MRYFYLALFFAIGCQEAFTQIANPDVQIDSCPYNIIFVLDESGSISGQRLADVEAGAKNLVAGVSGSGSRMAIVEFDCSVRRASIGGSIAYQTVDNTYVTNFNNYINGGGGSGNNATYSPSGGTNWAGAFSVVSSISSGSPPNDGLADLIIFFTDGNPNCGGSGVGQANAVKGQGSHIFVIGVTPGGPGLTNIQNISGTDAYVPGSTGSFLGFDYSLNATFLTPECR